ncbi:MAG: hypothetical protein M1570_14270 [Chloroflexi bacterium]|nr:hypothetical protein [Chloroflexota bacterium]
MSDSFNRSKTAPVRRPATNWPATVRDYLSIASFHRRAAERRQEELTEQMKPVPPHLRDAVEREFRLAATFEELADSAAGSERVIAVSPEPVFASPAELKAAGMGRPLAAARLGWRPAWIMGGLAFIVAAVLFVTVYRPAVPSATTFVGIVTDSLCGQHHFTSSNAVCVRNCVKRGAKYALYDGKHLYTLGDQQVGERFAGQSVNISGTLDRATKTVRVISIRRS